jgi:DNA-binding IclR family transcriptional regulator
LPFIWIQSAAASEGRVLVESFEESLMLGTVTRAGKALDLFTLERPTWGATAVSNELSIAKSQAHELLTSLSAIGLLRRVPGGQYRLGWRALALGRDVLRGQFPEAALKLTRSLAVRYQEPVQLVALDRDKLTIVARHAPASATGALVPEAFDAHLHCCAMSRCLLADLPEARRVELLGGDLAQHTPRTLSDIPAILEELERVRVARIAVDLGEVHVGLRAVAAPIKDADGHTVAGLGVWTTAERWELLGGELTKATVGIGRRVEAAIRASDAIELAAA